MSIEWIVYAIGGTLVALVITATVLVMRHREQVREAAREAEALNVISDDTRRAFWYAAADHPYDSSDHSSSDGGDSTSSHH